MTSDFSSFFTTPNATPPFELYLHVPRIPNQLNNRQSKRFNQPLCKKMSPLASHITFLLYQTWSVQGHGTLSIESSSKNNKLEVILGGGSGGMTYLHKLKEELPEIKDAYEQMHLWMLYAKCQELGWF
ncbi:hypothetical protein [Lusitaniella coriacea]|uniref:hypothetical protein n=1 Tax=Lusitaniella coriacea TaxID=1983105 RepID=UPI003CEFAB52